MYIVQPLYNNYTQTLSLKDFNKGLQNNNMGQ